MWFSLPICSLTLFGISQTRPKEASRKWFFFFFLQKFGIPITLFSNVTYQNVHKNRETETWPMSPPTPPLTQHKLKTKASLSQLGFRLHHITAEKALKCFYWSQMTHLYNKLWLATINPYLHPGIAYTAVCPLDTGWLALLCIHTATQIHIQTIVVYEGP